MLSKRFGIGASPSDARIRFDERKQQPNEKLDTFLDNLEALRIIVAPEEPLKTRNLEIMTKCMIGLLDHDLDHKFRKSIHSHRPGGCIFENESGRNCIKFRDLQLRRRKPV